MSALPYHKRYHGDALTGFMALTLEERGAYQTLLDMMYDRGGPLIDNERLLAGYMNCSIRKWRQLRDQLIAKHKIRITSDGLITNRRAQKEIENTSKTHRKLIEAGSKGGRKRAENEKNTNENNEGEQASLEPALSDPQAIRASTRSQSSVSKDTAQSATEVDPVKMLFELGISVLGGAGIPEKQARSLVGKWRSQFNDGPVLSALVEARSRSISQPVEWVPKWLDGQAHKRPGQRNFEDVVWEEHEMRQRAEKAKQAAG